MPDYTLNEYIKENNTYNEKKINYKVNVKTTCKQLLSSNPQEKQTKEMSSIKYYQIPHNR